MTCLDEFERKILSAPVYQSDSLPEFFHLRRAYPRADNRRSFDIFSRAISVSKPRERQKGVCHVSNRNQEREPRDVTGLSLTLTVLRDSGWRRNHGWNVIIPVN